MLGDVHIRRVPRPEVVVRRGRTPVLVQRATSSVDVTVRRTIVVAQGGSALDIEGLPLAGLS